MSLLEKLGGVNQLSYKALSSNDHNSWCLRFVIVVQDWKLESFASFLTVQPMFMYKALRGKHLCGRPCWCWQVLLRPFISISLRACQRSAEQSGKRGFSEVEAIKQVKALTELSHPHDSDSLNLVKALPGYAGVKKWVELKIKTFHHVEILVLYKDHSTQ